MSVGADAGRSGRGGGAGYRGRGHDPLL